ncbi:MAG: family 10 glycosylhydrolase [Phocaeicola sp.]
MKKIFLSLIVLVLVGCTANQTTQELPFFSIWSHGNIVRNKTDFQVDSVLQIMENAGIDGLFLETGNLDDYRRIIPMAAKRGIQVHAWRWTMNNGRFLQDHPEYYQVNRKGERCDTLPPYVNYYRWMCPNEPAVQDYLVESYLELAKVEGLRSVHFDYVRYCDVFLPDGLQPSYNLVQDHIMPEYDYCYCSRCTEGFNKATGKDAFNLVTPADSAQWLDYRLDVLTNVVNRVCDVVHQETNTLVTAAVFPTPNMSAEMVRQDWSKFKIDAAFPMLYWGFYYETPEWLGLGVKEGLETMEVKKPIVPGIYLPDCKTADDLERGIRSGLENGAAGIALFDLHGINRPDYIEVLQRIRKEYNK